jgi:hypothetical protein
MQNHDHSVEGDLVNANSAQTVMLASSAIDCGYEPWSCQTKDYKIGICCFSSKNAALRRNSRDWLARNQNNVSAIYYLKTKINPKQ